MCIWDTALGDRQCSHTDWTCWPTIPTVDVQALHNPDRLPHLYLLSFTSHPSDSSHISLLGVFNTTPGFMPWCLFHPVPTSGPPWYRNHHGLSIFSPHNNCSPSYSSSGVSSFSTRLDALWLCFHGNHTHQYLVTGQFVQLSVYTSVFLTSSWATWGLRARVMSDSQGPVQDS